MRAAWQMSNPLLSGAAAASEPVNATRGRKPNSNTLGTILTLSRGGSRSRGPRNVTVIERTSEPPDLRCEGDRKYSAPQPQGRQP